MTQKWTRGDVLAPVVPWLWPSDFWVGSKCLWDYDWADQEYRACYGVTLYGHTGQSPAYLMLHAVRGNGNDGGEITLALSDTPHYDLYAQSAMAVVQSNPRRREDEWR